MTPKRSTLLHLALVAVTFLVTGLLFGWIFFERTVIVREGTADTPAAMTSVNLMIDNGTTVRTWNTISWNEAMSIMHLLEKVATTGNITMNTELGPDGLPRVLTIDNISNDPEQDLSWQYWVNNNYEPRTPSKYYLKPGDIVVWKYIKTQTPS
jgi:hypothetical protein